MKEAAVNVCQISDPEFVVQAKEDLKLESCLLDKVSIPESPAVVEPTSCKTDDQLTPDFESRAKSDLELNLGLETRNSSGRTSSDSAFAEQQVFDLTTLFSAGSEYTTRPTRRVKGLRYG
jgi:hypothetical protein